jgi:hypothetical protein
MTKRTIIISKNQDPKIRLRMRSKKKLVDIEDLFVRE